MIFSIIFPPSSSCLLLLNPVLKYNIQYKTYSNYKETNYTNVYIWTNQIKAVWKQRIPFFTFITTEIKTAFTHFKFVSVQQIHFPVSDSDRDTVTRLRRHTQNTGFPAFVMA